MDNAFSEGQRSTNGGFYRSVESMLIDWGSHPKHMDMALVPQDPLLNNQSIPHFQTRPCDGCANRELVVGMQVCEAKNGG